MSEKCYECMSQIPERASVCRYCGAQTTFGLLAEADRVMRENETPEQREKRLEEERRLAEERLEIKRQLEEKRQLDEDAERQMTKTFLIVATVIFAIGCVVKLLGF